MIIVPQEKVNGNNYNYSPVKQSNTEAQRAQRKSYNNVDNLQS